MHSSPVQATTPSTIRGLIVWRWTIVGLQWRPPCIIRGKQGFDEKQMLLFVDNQHSCLKAYAVTLLDGCFSEARWAVIRINVDRRKKKKVIVPRFKRIDARPDLECNQCFCTRQRELRARLSCSLQSIDHAVFFFSNWKRLRLLRYFFHLSGVSEQNFVDFWSIISDRKYPIKFGIQYIYIY